MLTIEQKKLADKIGYVQLHISERFEDKVALKNAFINLKKEKKAVLLAHYYQDAEIQDLADFVGDSLELSRQAAKVEADIILFAGVHFMAETAKIINPSKKVILPDLKAGCSLAEAAPATDFKKFVEAHPDHLVITYINSSAEVKAHTDITCTSSNALKIVESIPLDQKIIFAPDKNLGRYIMHKTGRDMLLWDGACIVHEAFSIDKIIALHHQYPDAPIIAHPESETPILQVANFIGSTAAMLQYVKDHKANTFIIATEVGILHKMRILCPDKTFIPAPSREDNTCACSECAYMKMNTLEKLYTCLKYEYPEINVPEPIRQKAHKAIERMFELS